LVFGADAGFGATQNLSPVGDKTPQDQDIFVVRFFFGFAKTAKLRDAFIYSPSPAKVFLTLFWHKKVSRYQGVKVSRKFPPLTL